MAYQSPLTLVYNTPAVYESDSQYIDSEDPIQIWDQKQKGPTIMDLIEGSPDFRMFAGLVKKSGYEQLLRDPARKITMFVVPDSAFYKAPSTLLQELDGYDARSVVGFHMLKVPLTMADMNLKRVYVETFHPIERLMLDGGFGSFKIGFRHHAMTTAPTVMYNARIIGGDQLATNGIVHVISIPLVPNAMPVY
jgi:uncharacterized surface protein with fasciclin (FAS1) repeats